MKTKIKHAVLLVIALFAVTTLTGCPASIPPTEKISAKEAWEIMKSAQETLPDDAVPVYIRGIDGSENPIEEGKAGIWDIGFYSESESKIWNVHFYNEADREEIILGEAEERYTDVSLTTYDLTDWNIDSTEACEIAVQNGAEETIWMQLLTARLLDNDYAPFKIPEFVPESIKLCWVIRAGNFYYIDACTGEYLGNYTKEQFLEMNN